MSKAFKSKLSSIDLNDIRLFVAVVQSGSLTQASELLNLPKSYLSRHLTQLETALGTTLMDRGRRGVALNELGERFYVNAQEMLRLAQHSIDDIHDCLDLPHGLLRLSVSTEVGRSVLMHHLPEYLSLYPQVDLEVQIDNRKINMIQDGIDIAIRVGTVDNEHVVARHLMDVSFGLFATPDYLARHGTPTTPHELYHHQLIYKYDGVGWTFHQAGQCVSIINHARLRCNDFNLAGQMVADGVGIALLPLFDNLIRDDWVQLLTDWQIAKVSLYVIYYKNRGAVATVRSFVDYMLGRIRTDIQR